MSSSSYVDVLLRKGKRIAISYIISDCRQNEVPENAKLLHQVADSLLNPCESIDKPEIIEWMKWLLAAGKNPDEFAKEVKRFDTATTCGLVWIANFVAYRCRTCAISPCMSLCAECFQKGDHEGHDFNMFRSQAGGACDCGDESVMKKTGFCVRHTQKKKKVRVRKPTVNCQHEPSSTCDTCSYDESDQTADDETAHECAELLLVARALMAKIINRLLVELRRNDTEALKEIDVYINNLLNPLTSMGAAMRSVISNVLLDPDAYDRLACQCDNDEITNKDELLARYQNYVRTRNNLPNFDLHAYHPGCAHCINDACAHRQRSLHFTHSTFVQELVFWMVIYNFPQKLVCFLLNMLPDAEYKEAFAQSFVQHYSRISMMLANFRNYDDIASVGGKPSAHDLLSNCVVHVSVQLLSNENLAVKLCQNQHLLFIIIASLRATIEGEDGHGSNLIASSLQNESANRHKVVRCDHYVMKRHSYWPLVSDLNNILTHQQVAIMFIQNRDLFELWLDFIINFQAMNINHREFHKHVEFENDSYYASFSSELEICATPMWTIISHNRSATTSGLIKQVIQSTLRSLIRWFDLIHFAADDTPNPFQCTFHLPLHRYYSVFVRHAVENQGLSLAELLPDNEEHIKLLLAHPLQIQINFYEILCNLWVRNGLQIKGQAMTYIQCHFCSSMIDPDLFLIQQLSAKLAPDWFMTIVLQRFHVFEWFSLGRPVTNSTTGSTSGSGSGSGSTSGSTSGANSTTNASAHSSNTPESIFGEQRPMSNRLNQYLENEQLMPMLEGALTFLCTLFVVQTNLGLTEEQITRQEIVTLLCMSDRTHSQLHDLFPEKCGTTNTRGFEPILNQIADFRSPALEAGGNLSQGMFYPKPNIWLQEYDPIHVLLRAVHRRDYQASIDRFTQFIKSHMNQMDDKDKTFASQSSQPWPPFRLPSAVCDRYLDPKCLLYSKVLHGVLFTILYRAVHTSEVSDQVLALCVFLIQMCLSNTRPQRDSPAQRLASLEYAPAELPDMAYDQWFGSSWILENMNLLIQNVISTPGPEADGGPSSASNKQTPLDGMEVDLHLSDHDDDDDEDEYVYPEDEYMHDIDIAQGQIENAPPMSQLPGTQVPLALTHSSTQAFTSASASVSALDPQPSGSGLTNLNLQSQMSSSSSSSSSSSNFSSAVSVISQLSEPSASNVISASNAPSECTYVPSIGTTNNTTSNTDIAIGNTSTSGSMALVSVTTLNSAPSSPATDSPSSSSSSSGTTTQPLAIPSTSGLSNSASGPSDVQLVASNPLAASPITVIPPPVIVHSALPIARPPNSGASHPTDRPLLLHSRTATVPLPGPSTSPGYSDDMLHTGNQVSFNMELTPVQPLSLQLSIASRSFSPATPTTSSLPFLRRSHATRRRMHNSRHWLNEYHSRSASSSLAFPHPMDRRLNNLMKVFDSMSTKRLAGGPSSDPRTLVPINESFVSLLIKLHSKLSGSPDSYQPKLDIDLNNLNRIGDGAHFVAQCLDTFCALNSNSGVQAIAEWKAKIWPHLYKTTDRNNGNERSAHASTDTPFSAANDTDSPGSNLSKDERRRKAKERQQKLMAEFANKQKAFMKQMNEEMGSASTGAQAGSSKEDQMTVEVCNQLQYECVICGQTTPSTPERLVGMVILLQSTSILAHCSPKYPLATLKMYRNLDKTAKHHEDRLRLTDDEAIKQHKKETLGNYMVNLIDALHSFDASSWLNAINIGWEGGVHVQSCGHYIHLDCHRSYMQSLKNNRQRNRSQPESSDFSCPLCRQLANSVLPVNPSINKKADLASYLQTERFNARRENLNLVDPLIDAMYNCNYEEFMQLAPLPIPPADYSPEAPMDHQCTSGELVSLSDLRTIALSVNPGITHDQQCDRDLIHHCTQLLELYTRFPPPDAPFLKSLGSFCEDLTMATAPQYRSVLQKPTSHSLYLYMCSILRTNLETELLVRVSGSTPTGAKKSCLLPLFHALAANAHVLIPTHYTPLWSGLTGLDFQERLRSIMYHPDNAVPFLLFDASALLIQLIFALPLNVDSSIFDTVVQILYNLVSTQAIAQLCFTFNDAERAEIRNHLRTLSKDTALHTLQGLLGQVMDTLESANGGLFTCLQDEEENKKRTPWPDNELSAMAKQICLPFLRLASLLKAHLYLQEWPNYAASQSNEYDVLCGMLNLRHPGTPSARDFGFRLPYFVCSNPILLLSTWLNQYLHFVDKKLIVGNRLLHCRPVHFTAPRLLSLPPTYDQLFLHYYQKPCSKCNTCPKEPCICLLCGTLVCMRQNCCQRIDNESFEAAHHASVCGAGTALYLAVHSSTVIVIRGKRACVWGSVYLDVHGEEDRDLKRGRPLYLSQLRFAVLEQQWLTHSFDHTNKRWVWHKDSL